MPEITWSNSTGAHSLLCAERSRSSSAFQNDALGRAFVAYLKVKRLLISSRNKTRKVTRKGGAMPVRYSLCHHQGFSPWCWCVLCKCNIPDSSLGCIGTFLSHVVFMFFSLSLSVFCPTGVMLLSLYPIHAILFISLFPSFRLCCQKSNNKKAA